MRYFVLFAYNGSDFHGSQAQPNGITVQAVMENALQTIVRMPLSLTFAGRTDAGVHAEQMWAHFDMEQPLCTDLILRLNSLLPASIAIRELLPVVDDAHARFSAISRTYEYRITEQKNPFLCTLTTRVAPGLNYEQMNEAAKLLLGKHDFASFCKVHTDVKTTFCSISHAEWSKRNDVYIFTIQADRFLRNMVRAIVGTLFDVGRGKVNLTQMQYILNSHNRCAAGQSAPAEGLYLTHIEYPKTIFLS